MSRSHGESKHHKILRAAVKVFAQKGFYNARVSEIAKEAQVADGTIYLYFKNKDDILIHLFEEEMDGIIQNVKTAVDPLDDPLDKIRAFVKKHLEMVEEDRLMAEVIQVELRQSTKFMKDYKNRKFRQYLNLLADIIREGQKRGVFRPDLHPAIAKRVIFGALDEISTVWVLAKNRIFSVDEAAKQVGDILLMGVVESDHNEFARGLSSQTPSGLSSQSQGG